MTDALDESNKKPEFDATPDLSGGANKRTRKEAMRQQ